MPIAEFLKSIEAFQSLSAHSLEQLTEKVTTSQYQAGAYILRQGDPGDAMYILREGEVEVPILDNQGRKKFTAQLTAGQFFGEMALLTGEPRSADVIARTDCTCLIVTKTALEPLLEKQPQVAAFLTEILGQRLMEAGIQKVGKYRLIGTLGRGGMAVVFEGIHPTIGRPVAIKMLSHKLIYDKEFADRFKNEARIIAALKHENIVEVFDTEEKYATYFIVMEKISGIDLDLMIQTHGPLPFDQARNILRQFAAALTYAHSRGIVHRDIKPSNLLVDDNGRVKLMDFGIAQHPTMEDSLEVKEGLIGTPEFMSPEQIMGEDIDGRTDIYALGLVAYQMMTGTLPFRDKDAVRVLHMHVEDDMPDPRELNPDLPDDLHQLIMKCTVKEPEGRFQSCQEIVDLLGHEEASKVDMANSVFKLLSFVCDKRHEATLDHFLSDVRSRARKLEGVYMPKLG